MRHSGPRPGPPLEPDCPGVPAPSPVSLYPQQAGVGGVRGSLRAPLGSGCSSPPPHCLAPWGFTVGVPGARGPEHPPSPPAMSGGSPHSAAAPPSQCLAVLLPLGPITRARAREHVSPGGQSQRRDPHSPARLSPALPGIGRLGGGRDQVLHCPPAPPAAGAGVPLVMPIPGVSGQDGGMKEWMLGWMWAWTDGGWDGEGHGRVDAGMDGHMDKCTPSFCRTHRGPASPQEAPGDSWGCWGGLGPCC